MKEQMENPEVLVLDVVAALASVGRASRGVERANMAARVIVILCFMVCFTLGVIHEGYFSMKRNQ